MRKTRGYSEETKAAVLAALMTGQSISCVAAEYRIPEGTIKGWSKEKKRFAQPVESVKKDQIADLLIGVLRETLVSITEQVKKFRDPAWLDQQSAEGVAMLWGVEVDKAVRLLEAFDRARQPPGAPADPA